LNRIFRNVALSALVVLCGLPLTGASQASRPATPADWFHVYPIDTHTYAISEPNYWQQNVSYLLIGERRALLFDTGPGLYSIREQVQRLTSLPVIAIPSHLHFDHVGDLEEFSDVRLLDTPALRAQVRHGYIVEPPSQYMLRTPFTYRVRGWVKDGQTIDLGARKYACSAPRDIRRIRSHCSMATRRICSPVIWSTEWSRCAPCRVPMCARRHLAASSAANSRPLTALRTRRMPKRP
jgi:hypothetical protein